MAMFMSVQFCKGIESLGSKGALEDIQKWWCVCSMVMFMSVQLCKGIEED